MKKILITGAGSYIGEATKEYLMMYPDCYTVDVKDTIKWKPEKKDFLGYDVVFNVAGVAHIKETKDNKHLYYEINRDLAIQIAEAAKAAHVKQFIHLSTMSVYGILTGHITKDTSVNPLSAYGLSKAEADVRIKELEDENFAFCCLRPPMVYGKGCKGNYQSLRSFALRTPIFPDFNNGRSMVYIGNLCCFVRECIDQEKKGLFFPQNKEYVRTSDMVRLIADNHRKKIVFTKIFNLIIRILPFDVIKKVFGTLTYECVDSIETYGFEESIRQTEG